MKLTATKNNVLTQFTSVNDVPDIYALADLALRLKKDPYAFENLGKRKTLGLIFLNPSLRTRMSTQKAAEQLGLNCIVLNVGSEGWAIETKEGVKMDGNKAEHIKEAAAVMGEYADILGIRCFPSLSDKVADYTEEVLNSFIKYCNKPVISLESATRHPLQSLADFITIQEHKTSYKPKVVLCWAPHIKALPQAVPNSFAEWMNAADYDFHIAQPEGYELTPEFSGKAKIHTQRDEAIADADFIYLKNWSKTEPYGAFDNNLNNWFLSPQDLHKIAPNAKIMHCLPVRRDVEVSSELLDSKQSLVIKQAANRVWAAQAVLKLILKGL